MSGQETINRTSTSPEELRIEVSELALKLHEVFENQKELILEVERLKHRLETLEHQLTIPD